MANEIQVSPDQSVPDQTDLLFWISGLQNEQKRVLEEEEEVAEKMGPRALTQQPLADLLPPVFTSLRREGDGVERGEPAYGGSRSCIYAERQWRL